MYWSQQYINQKIKQQSFQLSELLKYETNKLKKIYIRKQKNKKQISPMHLHIHHSTTSFYPHWPSAFC